MCVSSCCLKRTPAQVPGKHCGIVLHSAESSRENNDLPPLLPHVCLRADRSIKATKLKGFHQKESLKRTGSFHMLHRTQRCIQTGIIVCIFSESQQATMMGSSVLTSTPPPPARVSRTVMFCLWTAETAGVMCPTQLFLPDDWIFFFSN